MKGHHTQIEKLNCSHVVRRGLLRQCSFKLYTAIKQLYCNTFSSFSSFGYCTYWL